MSRPNIKTSLIAIFVTIAFITSAFAWLTIRSFEAIDKASTDVSENWLPSVKTAKELETAIFDLRLGYLNHVTARTPEAIAEADKSVAGRLARFESALKQYEPLVSSPEEGDLLNRIKDGVNVYNKRGGDMLDLSRANRNDEALAVMDDMRKLMQPILGLLEDLVQINVDGAAKSVAVSKSTYHSAVISTYVTVAIVFAIVIAAAIFAMVGIAAPIQKITESMRRLAGGDTASPVPFSTRTDEIGAMAGAVQVFREAATENIRLSHEAEEQRRSNEEQRVVLQRRAEEEARRKLLEATSALAVGMKSLAGGDLTFQITEQVSEDFEGLKADFNSAVKQLGETLAAVAGATRTIDNGTREISSGAEDLSRRTEQQAASLEETAAALDQITVNVSNSTKRAEEAREVATKATASATHSGAVVSEAVNAMSRIEESSSQISNIISVIDEISFQTNLLALNAGVEAARAGESGRGFAVVAQEVRELAQRSAAAAKEIKTLIDRSSQDVARGVSLVNRTGDALKTIGEQVHAINEHIAAIATSSQEQSTGIAEINTAITSMDRMTQQNAAMVEETNASTHTLMDVSTHLTRLVSRFSVSRSYRASSTSSEYRPRYAA